MNFGSDNQTVTNRRIKFAYVWPNCEVFRYSFFKPIISHENSLLYGIVEAGIINKFKLEVSFISGLTTRGHW